MKNILRKLLSVKHSEEKVEKPLKETEKAVADEEQNRIRSLKSQIETFIDLSSDEVEGKIDDIRTCLSYMEEQSIRIKKESNGYPEKAMSAEVWMDGYLLINSSEALVFFLSDKPYVKEEARATKIWLDTVLSICPHYHHLVGPAMIASASVAIKIGDIEYAKKAYSAVITDFLEVLESAEKEQGCLNKDDEVSINSLLLAIQGQSSLTKSDEEISSISSIQERINSVIDKAV